MRKICSSGVNTVIPVMAGLAPGSWTFAHLTATLPPTGQAFR